MVDFSDNRKRRFGQDLSNVPATFHLGAAGGGGVGEGGVEELKKYLKKWSSPCFNVLKKKNVETRLRQKQEGCQKGYAQGPGARGLPPHRPGTPQEHPLSNCFFLGSFYLLCLDSEKR